MDRRQEQEAISALMLGTPIKIRDYVIAVQDSTTGPVVVLGFNDPSGVNYVSTLGLKSAREIGEMLLRASDAIEDGLVPAFPPVG